MKQNKLKNRLLSWLMAVTVMMTTIIAGWTPALANTEDTPIVISASSNIDATFSIRLKRTVPMWCNCPIQWKRQVV